MITNHDIYEEKFNIYIYILLIMQRDEIKKKYSIFKIQFIVIHAFRMIIVLENLMMIHRFEVNRKVSLILKI